MKFNLLYLLPLLWLLGSHIPVTAQIKEVVSVVKKDGEVVKLLTTLRVYKGKYIFPDDNKAFIKGKLFFHPKWKAFKGFKSEKRLPEFC